jgi:hypothetical protein
LLMSVALFILPRDENWLHANSLCGYTFLRAVVVDLCVEDCNVLTCERV